MQSTALRYLLSIPSIEACDVLKEQEKSPTVEIAELAKATKIKWLEIHKKTKSVPHENPPKL